MESAVDRIFPRTARKPNAVIFFTRRMNPSTVDVVADDHFNGIIACRYAGAGHHEGQRCRHI